MSAETILEGRGGTVAIGDDHPFVVIGERINPTGRPGLARELSSGDLSTVRADAVAQVRAGARVLDVNAGIPGADETALLTAMIRAVLEVVDVPLSIDSSTPEVLEAVLPLVPGRPLVNSVTAEEASLARVLPLVARHGAAVIGMAHDDRGISMDPRARLEAARRIVEAAADHGIRREDVIIDPVATTVGTDPSAGRAVLETIRLVRTELRVNVCCGASNLSFGLPERRGIDAVFLPMAIALGMNCAITDPLAPPVRRSILAVDVLMGRDPYAAAWIRAHREEAPAP
jgi:5-methyltetrahydrofolate--homocysteine methyltransferase